MSHELIFFFDGLCPLCTREVNFLRQKDHKNKILFEDINQKNFEKRYKTINKKEAGKVLHGIWNGNELIKGLDVTYQAWRLVGYSLLVRPLRWPVLRNFFDLLYNIFAKHRHSISSMICSDNTCSLEAQNKYE